MDSPSSPPARTRGPERVVSRIHASKYNVCISQVKSNQVKRAFERRQSKPPALLSRRAALLPNSPPTCRHGQPAGCAYDAD